MLPVAAAHSSQRSCNYLKIFLSIPVWLSNWTSDESRIQFGKNNMVATSNLPAP